MPTEKLSFSPNFLCYSLKISHGYLTVVSNTKKIIEGPLVFQKNLVFKKNMGTHFFG